MKEINSLLQKIEEEKNVRILYACETGSRAWGFPSPDSDFDIRFIYRHPRNWYLALNEQKDSVEFIEGDLDITGWDLKKSLLLLKRSNAPLIERFQSPIVYYQDPVFTEGFRNLITSYYSPKAVFFHHYSLAKNFWETISSSENYKLKSFFYLVRSLLSCLWIMQRNEVVPMQISPLLQNIDTTLAERIRMLISLKATVSEAYLHDRDAHLHEWIASSFELLEQASDDLGVSTTDMSFLNQFFIQTLEK